MLPLRVPTCRAVLAVILALGPVGCGDAGSDTDPAGQTDTASDTDTHSDTSGEPDCEATTAVCAPPIPSSGGWSEWQAIGAGPCDDVYDVGVGELYADPDTSGTDACECVCDGAETTCGTAHITRYWDTDSRPADYCNPDAASIVDEVVVDFSRCNRKYLFETQDVRIEPPTVTCGDGASRVTEVEWATQDTICAPSESVVPVGTCRDETESCLPRPAQGSLCISAPGDLPCPEGFPTRSLRFTGATDTRTCTGSCECGEPTGGACQMMLDTSGSTACITPGPDHWLRSDEPPLCVIKGGVEGFSASRPRVVESGTCSPTGDPGAVTGGTVTPTGAHTVCCVE